MMRMRRHGKADVHPFPHEHCSSILLYWNPYGRHVVVRNFAAALWNRTFYRVSVVFDRQNQDLKISAKERPWEIVTGQSLVV